MRPGHWQKIERICNSALSLPLNQRESFLEKECEGDRALRKEVDRLLCRRQEAEALFAEPVLDMIAGDSPGGIFKLDPEGNRSCISFKPGVRLGPYEITSLVGAGGMGEVYKATDRRLGRTVAVKVLPPALALDPERRRRFEQEARAVSALNHPNICTLYDIGSSSPEDTAGAQPVDYLVMEFLEGETLAECLSKGRLRPVEAIEHAAQIADALGCAHARGIVHRDLKPGNIMLTPSGVKLLDFGLAKLKPTAAADVATGSSNLPTDEPATSPGTVLGTVPYMAPEQVKGKATDARSDIFSFGAVFYEMLTGRRAFEGESQANVAAAILEHDPPPLSSVLPAAPAGLQGFVTKCLAKEPDARPDTAEALADELRSLAGIAEHPVRRWRAAPAVLMLAAVVLSLSAWFVLRPGREETRATFDLTAPPRPLTSLPGIEKDPSLSPDGNHVAFAWNGGRDGRFHVYIVPVAGGEPFQLTRGGADDTRPTWSPSGDAIAFLRRAERGLEVWRAPFPAGQAKLVLALRQKNLTLPWAGLDWSPDGRYLVTDDILPGADSRAIFAVDIWNGQATALTSPPSDAALGDSMPVFSPTGDEVAFLRGWAGNVFRICCQRISNGKPIGGAGEVPQGGGTGIFDLCWSPDGAELFYTIRRSPTLWRIPRIGGEPKAVIAAQDAHDVSVDRAGRRMVYASVRGNADIWRMPGPVAARGTERAPFIRSTRNEGQPRYSPDGRHIAFNSDRSGRANIWLADADGNNQTQLTFYEHAIMPQWSPTGEALAFHRHFPGQGYAEIYLIGLKDAQPTQITGDGSGKGIPVWSPDGGWIYYNRRPPAEPGGSVGEYQIWKVRTIGGDSRQVTDNGQVPLGVDDRFVYFHRARGGLNPGQIWRAAHEGGKAFLVLDENVYPWEWSIWNESLIYIDRFEPDGPKLKSFDLVAGNSTVLASLDPEAFPGSPGLQATEFVWGGLTVSPDGAWILYGKPTISDADLMIIDSR